MEGGLVLTSLTYKTNKRRERERERESGAVSYLERRVDEEASVLLEVGFFRGIFVDDDLVFVIHLVGGNVRGQKLHAFRARPH